MTLTESIFMSRGVQERAHSAYTRLVRYKDDGGIEHFINYMDDLGFKCLRYNYQLTFIPKSARSEFCERMVFDMAGCSSPNAEMLRYESSSLITGPIVTAGYFNEHQTAKVARYGFKFVDGTGEETEGGPEQEDHALWYDPISAYK